MTQQYRFIETLDLNEFDKLSDDEQHKLMLEYVANYRKLHAKPEKKTYTCDICFEDGLTKQNMYQPKCGHAFCLNCWKESFEIHVEKIQEHFKCIQDGCGCVVEISDINQYNIYNDNVKLLENYSNQLTAHAFSENIKDCPKCGTRSFVQTNKECVNCPNCRYSFCGNCYEDHHPGQTCGQYKAYKKAQNSEPIYSNDLKPCPNPSCRIPIFKDGGCQWMHCTTCGSYFCWICLQVTNNHQHRPGQVCNPHGDLNRRNN